MDSPKPISDEFASLLGSCRRRCSRGRERQGSNAAPLHLLCARIHSRAAAEDRNRIRGSLLAHNDAFWGDIEELIATRVHSVDELFTKVRACQTMWRHELRKGEPFHTLLRDLTAEGRTIEERLLYATLANVSELASRSLR